MDGWKELLEEEGRGGGATANSILSDHANTMPAQSHRAPPPLSTLSANKERGGGDMGTGLGLPTPFGGSHPSSPRVGQCGQAEMEGSALLQCDGTHLQTAVIKATLTCCN